MLDARARYGGACQDLLWMKDSGFIEKVVMICERLQICVKFRLLRIWCIFRAQVII